MALIVVKAAWHVTGAVPIDFTSDCFVAVFHVQEQAGTIQFCRGWSNVPALWAARPRPIRHSERWWD